MTTDRRRLRETFADPALAWIVERLRRRFEQGRALRGTMTLRAPSTAQRAAFERLLGRRASRGAPAALTLRLEELAHVLHHAELSPNLDDALAALVDDPLVDRKAERRRLEARWQEVFAAVRRPGDRPEIGEWLDQRRTRTLARRYSGRDPERGRALLEQALAVVRELPVAGIPLAELAASVTGDSHALDPGQRLGTLVISFAARLGRVDAWNRAEERRDAWAAAGVLVDELSAPVLVLNLRGDARSLSGRLLDLHAAAGEPCRLSTRLLLRHPPQLPPVPRVYVCENPAVVAAAAERLGTRCAPLVCVEGQPKTAARVLLDQLAARGTLLLYHGDFDWGGLRIANLVMKRHGARPWRFATADYLAAAGAAGKRLDADEKKRTAASWDPQLEEVMVERGRAVHEEQLLDVLLADLAQ